jgi:hypothetical protein
MLVTQGREARLLPPSLMFEKIKIKKYILKIKSVNNNYSFLNTLGQALKMEFKLPEHKA